MRITVSKLIIAFATCVMSTGWGASKTQIHVTVGGPGAMLQGMDDIAIQAGIDYVAGLGGGVVELTQGRFLVENAIYLRDSVILCGQGRRTVLKKSNAVHSLLAQDADMNETYAIVEDPSGFEVGMGVSVGDKQGAIMHLISVRTIRWIEDNILGFGEPFETIQFVSNDAYVQSTFPVIYAKDVSDYAVEDLTVDGNMDNNPMLNSWIDGGVYLLRSSNGRLANCEVRNVNADGISLNESANDVTIENCEVHHNARLGIHVGTGSQRIRISGCRIHSNGCGEETLKVVGPNQDGLFLCFTAQHGIYEDNLIENNCGHGVTLGHKDSDNLFVNNTISGNAKGGVFYRGDTYRTYNNVFRDCTIQDNSGVGFHISGDADQTTLERCRIFDSRPVGQKEQTIGVWIEAVADVHLIDCTVEGNAEEEIRREPAKKEN